MRTFVTLTAVLMTTSAAAAAPPPIPIIGGSATATTDFPSVVAIAVGQGLCTGTVVAPTFILTAGHCIDPTVVGEPDHASVVKSIVVIFGSIDVTHPGGTQIKAKEAYGAGFDPNKFGQHDLSLIELVSPAPASAPPIAVNLDAGRAPIGVPVTMVGFGATQGGSMNAGKEFQVGARMSGKCADVVPAGIPGLPTLSDANVMCYSQADGKGKCEGDSGGPSFAMIDGVQTVVGVTSFGDSNCASFGVDTRTDIESDFLLSHVDLCSAGSDCSSGGGGCCSGAKGRATAFLGLLLCGGILVGRRRLRGFHRRPSDGARTRGARRTAGARASRRAPCRAG